jgi:hypothetical protein
MVNKRKKHIRHYDIHWLKKFVDQILIGIRWNLMQLTWQRQLTW